MYPKINTIRGTLNGRRNATWEYSDFQDILDIHLEPDACNLVYEEIEGQPGISRAYDGPATRLAGISAECVTRRLNAERPTDAQLAALAEHLVAQFAPPEY
ncbi:MAG: hypothetical protein OXF44_00355 [Anaerolineaceae bacterium]|nr:hypothetical protein [Anaerolineaceae bacterium]MCY4023335.1 hypothetical protein [Anaerolineaceae bacterium]